MWWLALHSSMSQHDLSWWALRWTPLVALVDEAVLMEISASERLFGGRAALHRAVLALPASLEESFGVLTHGQGPTSLAALACLREQASRGSDVSNNPVPAPGNWSLAALSAATPHLPVLHRLGCRTWADLDGLPRGGVLRRFGQGLLDAMDVAMGRAPDLYPWVQCPEVFVQDLECTGLIESTAALMVGAQRLLQSLHLWLQVRQRAVLALQLRWTYDERRLEQARSSTPLPTHDTLVIRTTHPTCDTRHLARLMAEHLAHQALRTPVCAISLSSLEIVAAPAGSASLLPDDLQQGDSLPQLLERLSARLGPEQVRTCQLQQDHRPECMQVWHSAVSSQKVRSKVAQHTPAAGLRESALYPPWLLAQPLALQVVGHRPHYQGPLRLLLGPQRLEAGWWGGDDTGTAPLALRDYFVASSPQAGLVWVYRAMLRRSELAEQAIGPELASRWFLHGFYG